MLINANFSTESELKQTLDFMYARSKEGKSFHGLLEIIQNKIIIVTAVHNIKSNKGAYTSGLDEKDINYYLQMSKEELFSLIQKSLTNYRPKPVRRIYIPKSNGKMRPLGIPTVLDRIIQECIRIIIEPIVEARFYPHSYGFRPLRSCKDAILDISSAISNGGKDKPVHAIEGDIKGFFDNVNHRTLLNKLFNMGIHDKRVIAIIRKMLKAGYFEDKIHETTLGTPQGGILSPLLANVYLNSFDWTIGRMYQEPVTEGKSADASRSKLRRKGTIPKYLTRYADDWIVLTRTQKEAKRLHAYLKRYFKYKLKLELSEEKTTITNLTEKSAKFLGFLIKVEKARRRPDNKDDERLWPKPYPDREKVKRQVSEICDMIKRLKTFGIDAQRAVQIEKINSIIVGIMEYWKIGICSNTYTYIDSKIYKSALLIFKKIYPKTYKDHWIPISDTGNRLLRHRERRYTRTWAVKVNDTWVGITKACLTHSQQKWFPFNQRKTPYTQEGRMLIMNDKKKPLPLSRPTLYDATVLEHSLYRNTIYNFEYYMNREYAYNRDKGKCRLCNESLSATNRHCHHVDNRLEIDKINKVSNLAWMHDTCHRMVHNNQNYGNVLIKKIISKLELFRQKLAK